MRILFLLGAFVLLATFAPLGLQRRDPPPTVSIVRFDAVALEEAAPERTRLGRLLFLGGWALTSNDQRFGGVSALHVDGGEALALSDAGWRIRFPLPPRRTAVRANIAMIHDGPGPEEEKSNRDVESVAVAGKSAWIGYEQANAVWRYDLPGFTVAASAAPKAMEAWNANHGAEAMVRLPDGRFLAFDEGDGGESEVLLFAGDPAVAGTAARKLRYRPPAGYRVTDAALLPDGRLAILHRRVALFEGFTAKLTLAAVPAADARLIVPGEEIAAFEGPVSRDNFEALSVTREGGRTILWLASDDNYNALQRTLLMKFALE